MDRRDERVAANDAGARRAKSRFLHLMFGDSLTQAFPCVIAKVD